MTSHGLGKQVSSASQPQRAGPRLTPRWRPLGQRSEQAPLAGHASEDAAPVSDGCEGCSVAAAAAPAAAGAGQVQYASLLCVPPLTPATDSDANGQDSGPDVAMTLPEPCLPLRQKSELQQHEQQRNLQSGHSPTDRAASRGRNCMQITPCPRGSSPGRAAGTTLHGSAASAAPVRPAAGPVRPGRPIPPLASAGYANPASQRHSARQRSRTKSRTAGSGAACNAVPALQGWEPQEARVSAGCLHSQGLGHLLLLPFEGAQIPTGAYGARLIT